LEQSLRTGPMDQRQAALRRSVSQISIEADSRRAELNIRTVPVVNPDRGIEAEGVVVTW
jgi:hypothetical protein